MKDYFRCRCPEDLKDKSGVTTHRTPVDCLTKKEDIDRERKRRKQEAN